MMKCSVEQAGAKMGKKFALTKHFFTLGWMSLLRAVA